MPSITTRNEIDASLLPDEARDHGAALCVALIAVYLLLIVAGYFALRLPGVMPRGNQLSIDRAVFATINAATLSGFQQTIGVGQSRVPGQITSLILTIGSSLIVMIVSGLALTRIVGVAFSDRQIIRAALVIEAGAIVIGGAMLLTAERGPLSAATQAAGAFACAGATMGPISGAGEWRAHAVLMPLALLGSLGVPVLLELRDWLFSGGTLSRFSRLVLALTAAAYVAGFLMMLAVRLPDHAVTPGRWIDLIVESSLASTNARLAGLPYDWSGRWPRAAQFAVMLLMLIGGTAGGLAGGIKLNTLVELFTGIGRSLRNELAGRLFALAAIWTLGYLLLTLVTLMLLTSFEPEAPADRLLFLAVSAVGNVGLSHDTLSSTGPSLYVLSSAMLLGRIAPLLLLWHTARTLRTTTNAVG